MELSHDFIENYPLYEPKPGEEYMSPEMLEHFKNKLLAWKKQLIWEASNTVNHLKSDSSTPADPNDRASQEEEFALELRTRDRERKLISKIDKSLRDIEDGEYGFCQMSGEPIGLARMEARPTATLTVEMKTKQEMREKQGIA
ncbi:MULTISPECIES: RNA polymerase-binding protein DksA [Piscirickettsiaceae]|jgi:DnaK suppressor protein|uniref:RNA polymerase-binding transcription factor DksA n=1 Tax=Hydrogenovibrio thermophilus TaxID=265883 RepID=A0A410H3A7_9GAMM|nr:MULTISPECIES: RNA polymerase-binding protein DksA [Piscirickettsiaceae]AZR82062.1 RNA polymerase-binding protein DksA [Thiomicrospira sp. S5]QAB15403.1 RNA polymerase-binding protein DksA [Hydrogenovibrio thermophilus]